MKATGIVRRIDELGRIVIPKEIRRTLGIREGTPIEIFTDREGEVILKKYSPMGELSSFANQYAESLGQITGFAVLISDREQIIACYGVGKADVLNKPVTKEIEERLNEREFIFSKEGEKGFAEIVEGYGDYKEEMAAPIIAGGDYIGGVFLLSKTEKGKLTVAEKKLLLTAASFLAKQMEE